MTKPTVPRVMPNIVFRMMNWTFRVMDLFGDPTRKLDKVQIARGTTVVDYACGPGRYTPYLARAVGPEGKVYAVDNQPLAIEMVREKASHAALANIEVVLVDAFDTGIPESSVDLVVFLDALHHIPQRRSLFEELHRMLKPEGRIFLEPGHMRLSRAKEIIEGTGLFDVAETWTHEFLLVPKGIHRQERQVRQRPSGRSRGRTTLRRPFGIFELVAARKTLA